MFGELGKNSSPRWGRIFSEFSKHLIYHVFVVSSLISSIHSYNTRQSEINYLFVKSVHITQYGIRSLSYTGQKLWNSLSMDVKKKQPFSSLRHHIKNSVIDGYNTIVDS